MKNMETIMLNNGVEMPLLGYGVFKVDPKDAERCVRDALSVGYRMIDTAQFYANEEGVGNAIAASGIPRKDIFLVTKIWLTNGGEERAYESLQESLKKLQTDYVDLLLVHQPYGDYYGIFSRHQAGNQPAGNQCIQSAECNAGHDGPYRYEAYGVGTYGSG